MIKVSVLYPSGEGKTFDMDYYVGVHFALVREVFGNALKRTEIEKGLSGPIPGSEPTYAAAGHLMFDSVDAFLAIMSQAGHRLIEDIPNYTDISPVIQVSEVIP